MDNLDYIIESIIDPTRDGLDPRVFDEHGGYYHMKSYHASQLKRIIDDVSESLPVLGWYVKGSILSRQWLDWSDVDVVVEIDPEIDQDIIDSVWEWVKEKYGGERLAGTDHEIEVFLLRGEYDPERTEGLYDVEADGWVKGPYDMTVDLNEYFPEFERQARGFDQEFGELERDVTDYMVYQSLSADEISALKDQVESKIKEIDRDVERILVRRDMIKSARKRIFDKDMSPDEISDYGSKQKLPANVIQKMLERYKYMTMSGSLRKIKRDDKRADIDTTSDVEKIGDVLGVSEPGA